jgi:AraC-like DNA-binding protein
MNSFANIERQVALRGNVIHVEFARTNEVGATLELRCAASFTSDLSTCVAPGAVDLQRAEAYRRAAVGKNAPAVATAPVQDLPVPETGRGCLAPWQARRVAAFIASQIDTRLDVSLLARVTKLSTSHFRRAFRRTFGVAPHAYVLAQRVAAAKRLMLLTPTPLAQVALTCGFTDQAHLSRVFRRATGLSPALWKRDHLSQSHQLGIVVGRCPETCSA